MEAKLLYTCDAWHSQGSMSLQGIFTDEKAFKQYLDDMRKDKKNKLSREDIQELCQYNQTQGRDLNYLIEIEDLNPSYKDVCK